jgi:hypothetical protein
MKKNDQERCNVCGSRIIIFGYDGLCLACENARQEQTRREQERKRREAFGSEYGYLIGKHI